MIDKTKIDQALDRAYEELRPFSAFYKREKKTYRFLLNLVAKYASENKRVVDVGTGIGIMPLALKFLGFTSQGVDKYIFNLAELDKVKEIWQKNNLPIYEYDMAKDQKSLSQLGLFDIVLSSSTIEHIKSPRIFLQSVKELLRPNGTAMILTPNASFISKRIRFLFGFSPFCELKKFFDSDGEKFSGHWREYTLKELKQMCAWAGLKVIKAKHIDNSPYRLKGFRDFYYLILKLISFILTGGKRAIIVICQK